MKNLLQRFGEKLREWFGSEKADDKPTDYIKTNRNGRLYVEDLEGYLEAGDCFDEMKKTSEALKDSRVYQRRDGTRYVKSSEFAASKEGRDLLKKFTEQIEIHD